MIKQPQNIAACILAIISQTLVSSNSFLTRNCFSSQNNNYSILTKEWIAAITYPLIIDDGKKTFLNGRSHKLSLSSKESLPILLSNQSSLLLTNITITNFDPNQITLEVGSQVVFDKNTNLIMSKRTIKTTSLTPTMNFVGNSILNLSNSELSLEQDGAIKVLAGGSLTIKNGILNLSSSKCIILEPGASLTLKNVKALFSCSSFLVDSGTIKIEGKCSFSPNACAQINFFSSENFLILSRATLTLSNGIAFIYNPNIGSGSEAQIEHKQHFKFQDSSATLIIQNAKLITLVHGLWFDVGKIIILGKVRWEALSSGEQASWHIGPRCLVSIANSATLINNAVLHCSS